MVPSLNDGIKALRRGDQGFCDKSTKAFVLKSVTMGERGVQNCIFYDDDYQFLEVKQTYLKLLYEN